jgi:C4-type Zn-finger protein
VKHDRGRNLKPGRAPEAAPPAGAGREIACPHCGSTDVELEAPFGSTLMTRQYYCRGCRTVFEWVRWEDADPSDWLRA